MTNEQRLCKLHSLEFGTFEIVPGQSFRLGRHRENDLVLDDTAVSRFHARITWDKQMTVPAIFDNSSQNGTVVDGDTVRSTKPLKNGSRISIGSFVLRVELIGCDDNAPAVLNNTDDMVALFSDEGPELRGELRPDFTMLQLMSRLETERRTGTLFLDLAEGKGQVVYCLGRLMSCELAGRGKALRALEAILTSRKGKFDFKRELEPQEEAMNLWVSDFIRSRQMDGTDTTKRFFRPTQKYRMEGRREGQSEED